MIYPPSQNIPPLFNIYATLPESTPPSQNRYPLLATICDSPIIYPVLPEYTLFFYNYNIVTLPESILPSQNLPALREYTPSPSICDPPIIYPSLRNIYTPFWTTICNAHIIYPSRTENTPPPLNIYMQHSQNPPSDQKYTPTLNICDPPRIYPSLPE